MNPYFSYKLNYLLGIIKMQCATGVISKKHNNYLYSLQVLCLYTSHLHLHQLWCSVLLFLQCQYPVLTINTSFTHNSWCMVPHVIHNYMQHYMPCPKLCIWSFITYIRAFGAFLPSEGAMLNWYCWGKVSQWWGFCLDFQSGNINGTIFCSIYIEQGRRLCQ